MMGPISAHSQHCPYKVKHTPWDCPHEPDPTVQRTMHIVFPQEAPRADVDAIQEAIVEVAYKWPRDGWDTFAVSHAGDCTADPHCAGTWRDRAVASEAKVRAAIDSLERWVGRGHDPECPSGSGPCERCAKAAGAKGVLRILDPDTPR